MNGLVACRTCAEPVAPDAARCPHCGAKEPTLNRAGRILVGGAGLVAVAVFVVVALVILSNVTR